MSTAPVTAYLDVRAVAKLEQLCETGLYGEDLEQVAETLILEGLRRAQKDGLLEVIRNELAPPATDVPKGVVDAWNEAMSSVALAPKIVPCGNCDNGRDLPLGHLCAICGRESLDPPETALEDQLEHVRAAFQPEPPIAVRTPNPTCWLCEGTPTLEKCDVCGKGPEVVEAPTPKRCVCQGGLIVPHNKTYDDCCELCGASFEIPF